MIAFFTLRRQAIEAAATATQGQAAIARRSSLPAMEFGCHGPSPMVMAGSHDDEDKESE